MTATSDTAEGYAGDLALAWAGLVAAHGEGAAPLPTAPSPAAPLPTVPLPSARLAASGAVASVEAVLPEALTPLLGVAPFPGRHGCAMLPWQALREALAAKR